MVSNLKLGTIFPNLGMNRETESGNLCSDLVNMLVKKCGFDSYSGHNISQFYHRNESNIISPSSLMKASIG